MWWRTTTPHNEPIAHKYTKSLKKIEIPTIKNAHTHIKKSKKNALNPKCTHKKQKVEKTVEKIVEV